MSDIEVLSLRARLAMGLHMFAKYCDWRGLAHPELTAFLDYLWQIIELPNTSEAFDGWVASQPALVDVGLGYEYPAGFESLLGVHGVPEREFRHAICCVTEILYSSLYGAADEPGSRRFLSDLTELVAPFGIRPPDTRRFAGSLWSDGHGWGAQPAPQVMEAWRLNEDD
jgi:hypothetical protein